MELLEKYPEFRTLYEEVYIMCQNMEEIMGIFSEELAILDKNTVLFMIEEMEEEMKLATLEGCTARGEDVVAVHPVCAQRLRQDAIFLIYNTNAYITTKWHALPPITNRWNIS